MKTLNIIFSILIISFCLESYSFAGERYYKNFNSKIEFRAIAIENTELPIEELSDTQGNIHPVEKTILLHSSDVRGITTDENQITLHFSRNSWAKVREVSLALYNSKLAIIKDDKIFFAPTMASTIDKSAKLTQTSPQEVNVQLLMDGFVKGPKPQNLNSKKDYIQFLQTWLSNHPNDKQVLRDLVFEYIPENDYGNCEKAILYLEKILEDEPIDFIIGLKLINCFIETKNNEKALRASENLLPNLSDEVMKYSLVGAIGEIYYRLGMLEEAIQKIEIALNYYKTAKNPGFAGWENYPPDIKEQAIKQFESRKKEAISIYEETLANYKKELKEQ